MWSCKVYKFGQSPTDFFNVQAAKVACNEDQRISVSHFFAVWLQPTDKRFAAMRDCALPRTTKTGYLNPTAAEILLKTSNPEYYVMLRYEASATMKQMLRSSALQKLF